MVCLQGKQPKVLVPWLLVSKLLKVPKELDLSQSVKMPLDQHKGKMQLRLVVALVVIHKDKTQLRLEI